jgi:hypothetical protein
MQPARYFYDTALSTLSTWQAQMQVQIWQAQAAAAAASTAPAAFALSANPIGTMSTTTLSDTIVALCGNLQHRLGAVWDVRLLDPARTLFHTALVILPTLQAHASAMAHTATAAQRPSCLVLSASAGNHRTNDKDSEFDASATGGNVSPTWSRRSSGIANRAASVDESWLQSRPSATTTGPVLSPIPASPWVMAEASGGRPPMAHLDLNVAVSSPPAVATAAVAAVVAAAAASTAMDATAVSSGDTDRAAEVYLPSDDEVDNDSPTPLPMAKHRGRRGNRSWSVDETVLSSTRPVLSLPFAQPTSSASDSR